MPLDVARTRQLLKNFDFDILFIQELGWDHHDQHIDITLDGETYALAAIAEKRGMVAFEYTTRSRLSLPDYQTRRKIERQLTKAVHEHLIIFVDKDRTTQIWQWVKREQGKPTACREQAYYSDQTGEALIQKLQHLVFTLEDEENLLTVVDVSRRARQAFDVDRVTKRFYDRFKAEQGIFHKFISGIPDDEMQQWYVCVTLNRLMFVYFIQKKGFLDNDIDCLRNKLEESKRRGKDRYYKDFLCPLFFEGFAKKDHERSDAVNKLLGQVPYLNGGIFQKHEIETRYGKSIEIPDKAFDRIFDFFDAYQWHLDERPLRADNEINPDVLGYIFEKYINQKQMGAYYTKEDITEYISKNTVIPFLFDAARKKCKIAFEGEQSVWQLLQADPDRYIYDVMKKGAELPLPEEIAAGLSDVSKRTEWNRPALPEYALPTEIWREVVARRKRYEEVHAKLTNCEIRDINDFITYNLNIRQFAQDVIENCEGPELLRAFWRTIVGRIPEKSNENFEHGITILDPTCGSGAFLFAALNILEPLYEACLERMEAFIEELDRSDEKHQPGKFSDFRRLLEQVEKHHNRRYFIFKSIVVNNLFGMDIMEEAVEICKLRLFLKLVAQVEMDSSKPNFGIEPLPDIDFNIRAGNTLVGFVSLDEVKQAMEGDMVKQLSLPTIEERAVVCDRAFNRFRQQQTELGGEITGKDKQDLRDGLKALEDELNPYIASDKPLHWCIEFYGIMKSGGFDVVIGNPPYVAYSKVANEYTIRSYKTESCGNLYAFVMERSMQLLKEGSRFGMIVPVSSISGEGYRPLMEFFLDRAAWVSSYSNRPGKLFHGVEQRLTIFIVTNAPGQVFTTAYQHWYKSEREHLFDRLSYIPSTIWSHTGMPIKSGCMEAETVFSRLMEQSNRPLVLLVGSGNFGFWYHDGPTYWVRALAFKPNTSNRSERSNHYHLVRVKSKAEARVFAAVMSSSTFYFFFKMTSNCRDLGNKEWSLFPFGEPTSETVTELAHQGERLEKRLQATTKRRGRNYPSGFVEYEEYYPAAAKSVIDEVDRVLAQHYEFTNEELYFIINYDIKYRMGRESQEQEGEGE